MIGAFKDFYGTIISLGAKKGVGKLAGDVQEAYPKIALSIGYAPEELPTGLERDNRYSEIRTIPGSRFNITRPVYYWADIVASGIDPGTVSVIGIGHDILTCFEYLLALALGSKVAILESSAGGIGEKSDQFMWKLLKKLVVLPEDPYVLRAFVGTGLPSFPVKTRELLARALHEAYRYSDSSQKSVESMKFWEDLSPDLKDSNYFAVDHVIQKLNELGYGISLVSGGNINDIRDVGFNSEEVEILARMEHARWLAERLTKGWVHGSTKDFDLKTDPCLVPWNDLGESMREIDRVAVRKLPTYLKHFPWNCTR